ncbi:MAG: flagellar hook-length control protein FliK [Alphaproteobacteria bacterium]|nr:flagellar hook-length control protein FliK [Alphaproteobacteria bacterium]
MSLNLPLPHVTPSTGRETPAIEDKSRHGRQSEARRATALDAERPALAFRQLIENTNTRDPVRNSHNDVRNARNAGDANARDADNARDARNTESTRRSSIEQASRNDPRGGARADNRADNRDDRAAQASSPREAQHRPSPSDRDVADRTTDRTTPRASGPRASEREASSSADATRGQQQDTTAQSTEQANRSFDSSESNRTIADDHNSTKAAAEVAAADAELDNTAAPKTTSDNSSDSTDSTAVTADTTDIADTASGNDAATADGQTNPAAWVIQQQITVQTQITVEATNATPESIAAAVNEALHALYSPLAAEFAQHDGLQVQGASLIAASTQNNGGIDGSGGIGGNLVLTAFNALNALNAGGGNDGQGNSLATAAAFHNGALTNGGQAISEFVVTAQGHKSSISLTTLATTTITHTATNAEQLTAATIGTDAQTLLQALNAATAQHAAGDPSATGLTASTLAANPSVAQALEGVIATLTNPANEASASSNGSVSDGQWSALRSVLSPESGASIQEAIATLEDFLAAYSLSLDNDGADKGTGASLLPLADADLAFGVQSATWATRQSSPADQTVTVAPQRAELVVTQQSLTVRTALEQNGAQGGDNPGNSATVTQSLVSVTAVDFRVALSSEATAVANDSASTSTEVSSSPQSATPQTTAANQPLLVPVANEQSTTPEVIAPLLRPGEGTTQQASSTPQPTADSTKAEQAPATAKAGDNAATSEHAARSDAKSQPGTGSPTARLTQTTLSLTTVTGAGETIEGHRLHITLNGDSRSLAFVDAGKKNATIGNGETLDIQWDIIDQSTDLDHTALIGGTGNTSPLLASFAVPGVLAGIAPLVQIVPLAAIGGGFTSLAQLGTVGDGGGGSESVGNQLDAAARFDPRQQANTGQQGNREGNSNTSQAGGSPFASGNTASPGGGAPNSVFSSWVNGAAAFASPNASALAQHASVISGLLGNRGFAINNQPTDRARALLDSALPADRARISQFAHDQISVQVRRAAANGGASASRTAASTSVSASAPAASQSASPASGTAGTASPPSIEHVTIQLRPVELGRLQIAINFESQNKVKLSIAAESSATLELLKRDKSQLQSLLKASGIEASDEDTTYTLQPSSAEQASAALGGEFGGAGINQQGSGNLYQQHQQWQEEQQWRAWEASQHTTIADNTTISDTPLVHVQGGRGGQAPERVDVRV